MCTRHTHITRRCRALIRLPRRVTCCNDRVLMLCCSPPGVLVIINKASLGMLGFSWGHGQYTHARLVYFNIHDPILTTSAASDVGRLMRDAWLEGTEGVCARWSNTSSYTIVVRPYCPPAAPKAPDEPKVDFHVGWTHMGARHVRASPTDLKYVPPRSQHARAALPSPNVSRGTIARWAAATESRETCSS